MCKVGTDGRRSCCPPECMDWNHIDSWLNVHGMCPPGPPSMPVPPPAQPPPPCPPAWAGPTAPPKFVDAGTTCIDLYPTRPPVTKKATKAPSPPPIVLKAEDLKKKLVEAGELEDEDAKGKKEEKEEKEEKDEKGGDDNDDPLNIKDCKPSSCDKDDDDEKDNNFNPPNQCGCDIVKPVTVTQQPQQLMLAVPCNPDQQQPLGVPSIPFGMQSLPCGIQSLPCGIPQCGGGGLSDCGSHGNVVHHIHHHHVYHHSCGEHAHVQPQHCTHHFHHHRHHHSVVPCSCVHDE